MSSRGTADQRTKRTRPQKRYEDRKGKECTKALLSQHLNHSTITFSARFIDVFYLKKTVVYEIIITAKVPDIPVEGRM